MPPFLHVAHEMFAQAWRERRQLVRRPLCYRVRQGMVVAHRAVVEAGRQLFGQMAQEQ